ncbi:MAG: ACP S-malonyltransferase [Actinomycetota bacterium]
MLALLAPGQGAQTPGFLTPWIEDATSHALLQNWSSLVDLDLVRLGTLSDADEIRETSHAQPLLVAAGLISAMQTFAGQNITFNYFAGHSVGEITAASLAQVFDGDSALTLVSVRGRAMSAAAAGSNTGMSAVLGGEREAVVAAIVALGLTPANENGGGQIVAAGDLVALAKLAENPPAGSRVRPLQVSGAFHTSVMQPAITKLADAAREIDVVDPVAPVISNLDGAAITNGDELMARIVGQVAGSVRWDLCMETLATKGVTGVIEVAPGGTLTGMIKRAQPGIELFAIKTPEDIQGAREFARAHSGAK